MITNTENKEFGAVRDLLCLVQVTFGKQDKDFLIDKRNLSLQIRLNRGKFFIGSYGYVFNGNDTF